MDKLKYWDRLQYEPAFYMMDNSALPSDSIFREDIYHIRLKQSTKAQKVKDQNEIKQKNDKILRSKPNSK